MDNEEVTIQILPFDAIFKVFSYLSIRELFDVYQTNKYFYNACNNKYIWKQHLNSLRGEFQVENYNKIVKEFEKHEKNFSYIKLWHILTNPKIENFKKAVNCSLFKLARYLSKFFSYNQNPKSFNVLITHLLEKDDNFIYVILRRKVISLENVEELFTYASKLVMKEKGIRGSIFRFMKWFYETTLNQYDIVLINKTIAQVAAKTNNTKLLDLFIKEIKAQEKAWYNTLAFASIIAANKGNFEIALKIIKEHQIKESVILAYLEEDNKKKLASLL